jgi:hypothetical protein
MREMNENYDHQRSYELKSEMRRFTKWIFDYLRKTTAANLASLTSPAWSP